MFFIFIFCSFLFTPLRRSYQKQLARTTAEKGAECIEELTGPHRETHTSELAEALSVQNSGENKEDELQITVPEVTNLCDDESTNVNNSGTSETSFDLGKELPKLDEPVLRIKPITVDGKGASTLIVRDDIEIKKEELDDSKRLSFTAAEDGYLRAGYKKHTGSKTIWPDILKEAEYEFHGSRKRDTLRVRANSLKITRSRKMKNGNAKAKSV